MTSNHSPRLIAIDIGNSRTKFGFFEKRATPEPTALPVCEHILPLAHSEPIPWDEIRSRAGFSSATGSEAIVAGVNPNGLGRLLGEWARTGWKMPRIISASVDLPLRVDVDAPDKVGIDRLLNAVGANVVRQPGVAAIIVDTGTATTVDVISSAGAFRGGAILPGLELASRSLHLYTAFLPEIPIEELAALVPNPLGTSTRAALRAGIFWGQVGAVKELVERLSAIENQPVELYVTGGGGGLLVPHLGASARLFPALALQGLALVAERLSRDASQ